MGIRFNIEKDPLFELGNADTIWKKYCGFLGLSLEDFMVIQKALLMEQIELVWDTPLTRRIIDGDKPATVDEFRSIVPLTTYEDYVSILQEKKDDALSAKPAIWAHTSGHAGEFKWVPYTAGNVARLADDTLSAFILSAATRKGEVRVHPEAKVVLNLPPVPYITGIMARATASRLSFQAIPPLEDMEKISFQERIEAGYRIAMSTGVDFAASIAVVLVKVGETFSNISKNTRFGLKADNPMALWRVFQALVKSKFSKRSLLPRDIWKVKGLVCGGADTSIYRNQLYHYWGIHPLDAYVSTESGFIAMQGWNKKDMTFIPYSNFYEFIPEKEWLRSKEDNTYQPATVLLDEVKPGETYELVITNFHGGAFIRYRLGDLVKITATDDNQTGVKLPQMVFASRADELIDIAGFTRLDEKTIWAAIQNTLIPYEEWCARKEYYNDQPVLHIYFEPKSDTRESNDIARLIDIQLIALDEGYRDLRNMTGIDPIRVTVLKNGTFAHYLQEKQNEGFDLAHLKPLHINPPDKTIEYLVSVSHKGPERRREKNKALSLK